MTNEIEKINLELFNTEVNKYVVSYLREDEEWLVKNYFLKQSGKKMLVLGCGAGRTLRPLQDFGFDITAIDISPKMVEAAKLAVADLPIKIELGDATNLNFPDNTFDIIFFPFHGINYVHPDIFKAVEEAKRVLKPSGVFVYSSHNRLFLKKIKYVFQQYANYRGLITYRSFPWETIKLKKYFNKVKCIHRISISTSWGKSNLKDKVYLLLPFFSKSSYFICEEKK